MNQEEINKRIYVARRTMYNPNSTRIQLIGALKSIFLVSQYLEESDLRASQIMAKIYYLLGEYEISRNIYSYMLDIKEGQSICYLGIYKTYVGQGDIINIKRSLDNYKISIVENLNKCNFELIDALIDFNLNGDEININNKEKYLFFDVSIDEELSEKYNELIELVNSYKFDKALKLTEEMNYIVQRKKYFVEFFTLYKLLELTNLNYIKEISDNKKSKYSSLKKYIKDKNCEGILKQLKYIKNDPLMDNAIIIKGLYILIENNYLEDVLNFLKDITYNKTYKKEFKLLNIAIKEKNLINNLEDEYKLIYKTAIEKGRIAYKQNDLIKAFDIYSGGLFTTQAPIFYYYCGKILYKLNKFKEAEKYFLEYINKGITKIDKAYLYLSKIYEKTGKSNLSNFYGDMIKKINDMFGKEFDFYSKKEKADEEYDNLKIKVQNNMIIDIDYFLEHKLEDVKTYIELVKSGKKKEALDFLKLLEAKEDKSHDDVFVLNIIKRNKSLYNIKNK